MNRLIQFKSSRWVAMLLATVVAIITCLAVANATQTITTPNAVKITYSLAAGTSSAMITPATNTPVLVMGCITNGDFAVGQVSLVHIPGSGMVWEGLEANSTTVITGSSNTAGHHIVFIDTVHLLDIEVASPDTIKIHNADTLTKAG